MKLKKLEKRVDSVVELIQSGVTDAADVYHIFVSGGFHPGAGNEEVASDELVGFYSKQDIRATVTVNDILATPETAAMIPQVVVEIMSEAAEPMLVLTDLMTRINYVPGTVLKFGSFGPVKAASVGEMQEYPEVKLTKTPGSRIATVGKAGLQIRLTDEDINRSNWDIIGLHIKTAGRGLARYKEEQAADLLLEEGTKLYSNSSPNTSIYGPTTGRGSNLGPNGSFTPKDLFNGTGHMLQNGFMPDTLCVNPMTAMMWVYDPTMQALLFAASRAGAVFGSWTGDISSPVPEGWRLAQGMSDPTRTYKAPGMPTTMLNIGRQQSSPVVPGYYPFPLSFVVSPFIPYDHPTKLTDIVLLKRGQAGVIVVENEVQVEEWREPQRDVRAIKLSERYGFGMLDRGRGVGVFEDVKLVDNMVPMIAQPVTDVSALPEIDPTVAVV